ncbi:hypothetical protein VPH35_098119 [Triticum aestivum]
MENAPGEVEWMIALLDDADDEPASVGEVEFVVFAKVGNPYLNDKRNNQGMIDVFWTHGVMSDEVYANVTEHCDFAAECTRAHKHTHMRGKELPGYDLCNDYPTIAYLKDPAVQDAFHARMTEWSPCRNFTWKDAPVTMLPSIKFLIENKLPVWIFRSKFGQQQASTKRHQIFTSKTPQLEGKNHGPKPPKSFSTIVKCGIQQVLL